MMDTKLGNVPEGIQLYLIQARISPPNPSALYKLKHSGHPAPPAWYRSPTSELFTEMEPILFPKTAQELAGFLEYSVSVAPFDLLL